MPITNEQRLARRETIGSSDSAAILGIDPWRSAYDVFVEKRYETDELPETEAIDIGNRFEGVLLAWAAEELGVEIEVNVSRRHADGILSSNHDALVVGRREGIEAKTTSVPGEYGEEGTDQVPDRVIVQCHHQMYVSDLEVVWVPVLLARRDRLAKCLYRVDRKEDLIRTIVERDHAFHRDHLLTGEPPIGSVPSIDVLKRIRRVPDTLVMVDPLLVAAFEQAQAARKMAEAVEDEAKASLLAAAGTAEGIDYGDGAKIYTFREYKRTDLDQKALRRDLPDEVEPYTRISTYRMLKKVNRP